MYRSGSRGSAFKPPSSIQDKAVPGITSRDRDSPLGLSRVAGSGRADLSAGAFRRSVADQIHINGVDTTPSRPEPRRKQLVIPSEEDLQGPSQGSSSSLATPSKPAAVPSSSRNLPTAPHPFSQKRHAESRAHATTASPASLSRPDNEDYFMCTWRKPQARKHKTWDGDAVLIVNRNKGSCKLRCHDTGRELANSTSLQNETIESGDEMMIGGKEIAIDRQIPFREYLSGIPDKITYPPSKKHKPNSAASSSPRNTAPSSSTGVLAPAPALSFYSKPLPKPKARPLTQRVSPEVQRALQDEKEESHLTGSSASSSNLISKVQENKLQARYGGLTKPPRASDAVEPRYDPNEKGAIVMTRPGQEHERMYNRKKFPVVDVVVSPHLALLLRPHQVQGVKFLYDRVTGIVDVNNNNGAILADEMGLGKTLQTITLIDLLLRQSPYVNPAASKSTYIEKALIVCPLSLVKNWKREFRKWLGPSQLGVVAVDGNKGKEMAQRFVTSRRDQVLIIGYEKLRSCIEILSTAQPPVGLIVCDEGHRLKSKDAKTTKIFDRLSTPRRVILTGTPIQNDLSELYAMIDFVCPNLLGPYNSFKAIFEEPILRSRAQHCTKEVRETGMARSTTLSEVTRLVVLRRTADILEGFLLPKTEYVVFCTPTRLQLELYRHVLKSKQVRALTAGNAGGSALPMITMLRQLCDSPELLLKDITSGRESMATSLLDDAVHLFPPKQKRFSGDETLSGKLITLAHMLSKIRRDTDDKVVLVSTFTSTLDVLEAFCKRSKYACVRLDGQTKQDDRMDIVNQFNRAPASASFVFLLSTKAGGVGLNIIGANRLFLMEPEWNPALDQQAMARIHRDGQKKHCYIYRMMLPGTMDEKIFQRQISKLGLSETLMSANGDEKSKTGQGNANANAGSSRSRNGGSAGDSFSQDELKDIFTLHEDTPCLCHDLLVCSCGGRGASVGGADDHRPSSSGSSDDEFAPPSFIPASMQQASRDAQLAKEAKKRLAGLSEWRHYDTRNASDFATLSDDVLDGVVAQQKLNDERMQKGATGQTAVDGGGALFFGSSSPCSPSVMDDVRADERDRSRDGHMFMSSHEAGNIVFVFTKSAKSNKVEEADSTDSDEESGEEAVIAEPSRARSSRILEMSDDDDDDAKNAGAETGTEPATVAVSISDSIDTDDDL